MRLKSIQFLLSPITEASSFARIVYADPEDDWYWDDQARDIANRSDIHISRNKNLTLVALDVNENVIGAVWSTFERDDDYDNVFDDQETWRFDFDIAVDPGNRATGLSTSRVGPKLIDAALRYYKDEKGSYPGRTYIKCWVVNPKLANWLEVERGFRTEGGGEWHPSEPYMVYFD